MYKSIIALLVVLISISQISAQGSLASTEMTLNSEMLKLMNQISAIEEDHCEVPCGIYGDSLRVALIKEHISTVEKAMNQINDISASAQPNYNQLVRWVINKEKHAEEIQHIVAQYFLHQRVKMPKNDLGKKARKKAKQKYHGLLSSLHAIQVYAMKSKQTTDLDQIANLRSALGDFEDYYFHGHKH